jgi:hypothetical protein
MCGAAKLTVSTFGVVAGLAGIEHGVGEILQGSVPPSGLVIESWPGSPFFEIVAGEPAMTVIPNLLVTGILAVLLSLLFIAWVTRGIPHKYGSLVMVLLCLAMLLAGAGFGPPFLGLLLSIPAARAGAAKAGAAHPGRRTHPRRRHFLAGIWRGAYSAALAAWLMLFPGTSLLAFFFGVDSPNLVPVLFFTALGLLLLALVAAFARDSQDGLAGQIHPVS